MWGEPLEGSLEHQDTADRPGKCRSRSRSRSQGKGWGGGRSRSQGKGWGGGRRAGFLEALCRSNQDRRKAQGLVACGVLRRAGQDSTGAPATCLGGRLSVDLGLQLCPLVPEVLRRGKWAPAGQQSSRGREGPGAAPAGPRRRPAFICLRSLSASESSLTPISLGKDQKKLLDPILSC